MFVPDQSFPDVWECAVATLMESPVCKRIVCPNFSDHSRKFPEFAVRLNISLASP